MKKKVLGLVAVLILPVAASQMPAHAVAVPDDGIPSQSSVDKTADAQSYAGLWGDAPGGVAGRPFVKSLSVINAGVATPVISNGTSTTPEVTVPGTLAAVITPTNQCKTGQAPASGQCYSSPNRLGITVGYMKMAGQMGFNFTAPTDNNRNPLTLPVPVSADSVIDMVINMNTWGTSLRWTWMNGVPQYWQITGLGTPAAELHVKYKLATGPSQLCDSRVPVEACDPVQAAKNYSSTGYNPTLALKSDFILSLDTTGVGAEFNGSLFASENADLGSLSAIPVGSPTLGITYGVGGPNELGGAVNVAKFYAFVSDQSLLNYFGVTADVLNSADFATSPTMAITRADGGSQGESVWTRKLDADFGTSGYFLTVSGIKFNGASVQSQGIRKSALSVSQPAKFKVGNKSSNSVSTRKSGTKQIITASATTSACKNKTCRWVVSKSADVLSTTASKLTAVSVKTATTKVRSVITVKAASKTRLAVVLQVKSGGAWKFVTSRLVVAK